MEKSLRSELDAMRIGSPMAETLILMALRIARAADQQPANDLKAIITANKELRALLNDIAGKELGGENDDNPAEIGIFGAVRPEMVHAPAV
jgi:hypothetical protein